MTPNKVSAVTDACLICGQPPSRHKGLEKFCPMYATYRPRSKEPPSTGLREALVDEVADIMSAHDDMSYFSSLKAALAEAGAAIVPAALSSSPIQGDARTLVDAIRMRLSVAEIGDKPVLHVFDECADAAIKALSPAALDQQRT